MKTLFQEWQELKELAQNNPSEWIALEEYIKSS